MSQPYYQPQYAQPHYVQGQGQYAQPYSTQQPMMAGPIQQQPQVVYVNAPQQQKSGVGAGSVFAGCLACCCLQEILCCLL